jgi:hypothetical protein
MKKIIIILSAIAILLCISIFYTKAISEIILGDNSVKSKIDKLTEENQNNIYLAYFSLNELRSFSIIQIDKFSSKYDKKWIDPKTYAGELNNDDKELLRSKIIDYINSYKDLKKQGEILNKLYFWCYNEHHLNSIINTFSINQDTVTSAALNTDFLKSVNVKYMNQSSSEYKKLSNEDYKKAYYDMLELVSSLKPREQFAFYSTFYKELSAMGGY